VAALDPAVFSPEKDAVMIGVTGPAFVASLGAAA
jgi:hypothetical protein